MPVFYDCQEDISWMQAGRGKQVRKMLFRVCWWVHSPGVNNLMVMIIQITRPSPGLCCGAGSWKSWTDTALTLRCTLHCSCCAPMGYKPTLHRLWVQQERNLTPAVVTLVASEQRGSHRVVFGCATTIINWEGANQVALLQSWSSS